nr:hypothetical protein BgiMline_034045 [Biomphalaria glabrata]
MPRRPSSKKHPGKATVREHWGAGGRGQAITTNQIPAARRREADILGNIIDNIQTTGLDDKDKSLDEMQRKDGGETRGGTEKCGRPPYPEN